MKIHAIILYTNISIPKYGRYSYWKMSHNGRGGDGCTNNEYFNISKLTMLQIIIVLVPTLFLVRELALRALCPFRNQRVSCFVKGSENSG
jgi:hypothetical protein